MHLQEYWLVYEYNEEDNPAEAAPTSISALLFHIKRGLLLSTIYLRNEFSWEELEVLEIN